MRVVVTLEERTQVNYEDFNRFAPHGIMWWSAIIQEVYETDVYVMH